MPAVNNVLVVAAGLAGAATAIHLAQAGVAVDLIEIKPDVAALGSGITLQGNALRELRSLGVWDQVQAAGYAFDVTGFRAPDPAGTVLFEVPDAKTGGPDLPAVMGMPRPELAHILADRAAEVGVKLRLGTTFTELTQDEAGVDVTFSDGSTSRYDLVVGADGVRSYTRRALGINLETKSVGMGIWRAFGPRPASVTRTDLYYGGPSYIAGYCPTGEDSLYAYIVEDAQDRSALPRGAAGHHEAALPGLPRPVGRDPRVAHRPVPRELHVVRDPRARRAVEPRPGRAHRRRRAHLPAHRRPGRRHGPRGRRRPRRAAHRARQPRPGPVGRLH